MENGNEGIQMVLVGNKLDLDRQVRTEEGQAIADKYNIPFFETSAKENINISTTVLSLVNLVIENKKPKEEGIKLDEINEQSSFCKC